MVDDHHINATTDLGSSLAHICSGLEGYLPYSNETSSWQGCGGRRPAHVPSLVRRNEAAPPYPGDVSLEKIENPKRRQAEVTGLPASDDGHHGQ